MFETVKHGINLLRHSLRDVGVNVKRSSRWPTVEKHFRETHPSCAACGGKNRLNVHHIQPFHLFPKLELDPNNLITLCMGKKECHLYIGHLGAFSRANPNIRNDAAAILAQPNIREKIIKISMQHYYPKLIK